MKGIEGYYSESHSACRAVERRENILYVTGQCCCCILLGSDIKQQEKIVEA